MGIVATIPYICFRFFSSSPGKKKKILGGGGGGGEGVCNKVAKWPYFYNSGYSQHSAGRDIGLLGRTDDSK